MVNDYFTIEELARFMDIYEISAKELLDGTIQFTHEELQELAAYKGVGLDKLNT